MKEQRIVIEIDAEGRLTADAGGFTGDACLAELGKLLEGLPTGTSEIRRKRPDETATLKPTQLQLRSKP